MESYYYTDGKESFGPFSREELMQKDLKPETYVWYEGLDKWKQAGKLPEMAFLFESDRAPGTPPPIILDEEEAKPWNPLARRIVLAALALFVIVVALIFANNDTLKNADSDNPVSEEYREGSEARRANIPPPNPEIAHPLKYLSITYNINNRPFSKKKAVIIKLKNTAVKTTYAKMQAALIFYSDKDVLLDKQVENLEAEIKPQEDLRIKLKIIPPDDTERIEVALVSAEGKK